MDREKFEHLVLDRYNITADYPFDEDLKTAIFRHAGNRKWFAAVINVPKSKLGISGEGSVDVVDLKCAPEVVESLAGAEPGVYPAYHMNKTHWLTVTLNGECDDDTLVWLLDVSYDLTRPRIKGGKRHGSIGKSVGGDSQ